MIQINLGAMLSDRVQLGADVPSVSVFGRLLEGVVLLRHPRRQINCCDDRGLSHVMVVRGRELYIHTDNGDDTDSIAAELSEIASTTKLTTGCRLSKVF